MTSLLIIDPQNDFCDPEGSLYVPNAEQDMVRLSQFIVKNKFKINDIIVTQDIHKPQSIDKASWFINKTTGKHPEPFSEIMLYDYEQDYFNQDAGFPSNTEYADFAIKIINQYEFFTTTNPEVLSRTRDYLKSLDKMMMNHVVWPDHCVEETWGCEINSYVKGAIDEYIKWNSRSSHRANVNYIIKGQDPLTEHYSAVKPLVYTNQTNDINKDFVNLINNSDKIYIAGEASNFCVFNTIIDLVENSLYPFNLREKMVILTDCMSPVPGFGAFQSDFNDFIKEYGIQTMESKNA